MTAMDLGISNKVALVAAASKGFGRAIAHGLAAEGCRVAICARGQDTLQQAADEIHAQTGAAVLPIVADVTRTDDCTRFVDAAVQRWEQVDILVTNSGGPAPGDFDDFADDAWHAAFESTLLNVVRLVRLCVPHMQKQKWGRIVNVQSVSVKQPIEGLLLSNSIRPGAIGLCKTLANELGPHGILVNSILPGSHDTDRIRELVARRARDNHTKPDEEMRKLTASIPVGRLGQPEELANVVVFLCSQRASNVTGAALAVDGGACRAIM